MNINYKPTLSTKRSTGKHLSISGLARLNRRVAIHGTDTAQAGTHMAQAGTDMAQAGTHVAQLGTAVPC